jgi:cation:H+ antiporter
VPEIVNGSIILAVSSSFPEFATAVLAIPLHQDFELGLSAIIGSAIYNVLVIPAFSVFARRKSLHANRALVYREAQFYLVSVTVLLLVICFAVIYFPVPATDPDDTSIYGNLNRGLALLPVLLYMLYLFFQYEEVKEHRATTKAVDYVNPLREWAILLLCMALILAGVEILIRCAIALGSLLGTPTFLWGLTIVAAATSIPDTFISVKAARLDRSDSSISNVLGSNVFDLLIAVPAGVLLAGSIAVNFTQVVPMMAFLMFATVVTLVFLRRDMALSMTEAIWMTALYVAFGLWMSLEAFGVTSVLGLPT